MNFEKFERRSPSPQNAVDIFRDKWASDLAGLVPVETGGGSPFFTSDPRPVLAAGAFGRGGRLEGFRVLELGPLEGGHTFQLEHLGAREVIAIEANVEAYLKCLIVKETVGLSRSRFLLGDFCEYLERTGERFDLVFASGVLYHMADPIGLIESISCVTDRCFVWTHYYDADAYLGPPRTAKPDARDPKITRYEHHYQDMSSSRFWGGNVSLNVWLSRADVLSSFESAGLRHISVLQEHRQHVNGAAFSFAASRLPLE
jgi:hypothetical protein